MSAVKTLLSHHEGRRHRPYFCTGNKRTIGVGWNMTDNPLPPDIQAFLDKHGYITDDMIDTLLDISVKRATLDCQRLFPDFDDFTENRRLALVDLMFNMGRTQISKEFPSFCKAVNRGDWQRAADELKYTNGLTKKKLSAYWTQLHGDPDGTDDGKKERPETIYKMLVDG